MGGNLGAAPPTFAEVSPHVVAPRAVPRVRLRDLQPPAHAHGQHKRTISTRERSGENGPTRIPSKSQVTARCTRGRHWRAVLRSTVLCCALLRRAYSAVLYLEPGHDAGDGELKLGVRALEFQPGDEPDSALQDKVHVAQVARRVHAGRLALSLAPTSRHLPAGPPAPLLGPTPVSFAAKRTNATNAVERSVARRERGFFVARVTLVTFGHVRYNLVTLTFGHSCAARTWLAWAGMPRGEGEGSLSEPSAEPRRANPPRSDAGAGRSVST
eukprot:1189073-Prorocentrum_minimum.AAC.6